MFTIIKAVAQPRYQVILPFRSVQQFNNISVLPKAANEIAYVTYKGTPAVLTSANKRKLLSVLSEQNAGNHKKPGPQKIDYISVEQELP